MNCRLVHHLDNVRIVRGAERRRGIVGGHRVHANTEKSFPRINLVPSNLSAGWLVEQSRGELKKQPKKKEREREKKLIHYTYDLTFGRKLRDVDWLIVLYFVEKNDTAEENRINRDRLSGV